VWVCEVCERAPAAVTCRADAAALCAACDADIHDANPLARRHERVPVQPIGAAAPAAEALLFGAAAEEKDDDDAAAAAKVVVDAGKLDFLFADVMDPFFGQDFAGGRFPHADSVVPNNGSSGGAVDLDFGGGVAAAAKPSYSSYTAASLGHSVSVLISRAPDRLLLLLRYLIFVSTLVLVEQGSSSEVGLVPDVMCGRGGSVTGGVIELDFAQSKAAYLPYAATPTHSVRPCDSALPSREQQPTFIGRTKSVQVAMIDDGYAPN
jgi:hypothetical protein